MEALNVVSLQCFRDDASLIARNLLDRLAGDAMGALHADLCLQSADQRDQHLRLDAAALEQRDRGAHGLGRVRQALLVRVVRGGVGHGCFAFVAALTVRPSRSAR